MNKSSLIKICGVAICLALFAAGLVRRSQWKRNRPSHEPTPGFAIRRSPETNQRQLEMPPKRSDADVLRKIGEVSLKLNDTEFSRLKIQLPSPVDRPWKGLFWDSKTCFDGRNKSTVVRVLPGWIRKAVIAGENEMAGRFLATYLRFTEDADPEIGTTAVVSLYRMGDYGDVALKKMKSWIEEGFDYRYSDSTATGRDKDIRAQILEEFSLNEDPRLMEVVYETWLATRGSEDNTLASVDYAYYLERHGRELPADYWMGRLDNPYGFANALEVVESKGLPQVTAKLQTLFEEPPAKPATTPDSQRAAKIASALFRQTGDVRYRDYLIDRAQTQIALGSFEKSLATTLVGLAGTNDKAALDIVSSAMQNENVLIRESAIDALGKARDPAATDLLFEAGMKKAKQGTGFPARELRALLTQNNPKADSKYDQLQQALLGGQLGWSATASDFENLEFFRKYGR